jgi:hypothetical protein
MDRVVLACCSSRRVVEGVAQILPGKMVDVAATAVMAAVDRVAAVLQLRLELEGMVATA